MVCPVCNKEIKDNSKFCGYCGAEFTGRTEIVNVITPENEPVPNKPKTNNYKILIVAISAVVILMFVGIIVLFATGKMPSVPKFTGESITDAEGEVIKEGKGTTTMFVKDIDGTTRQITTDRSLLTKSSILDKYTSVTSKLKTAAPGFTRSQYQNLPTENQSFGNIGNLVLPIIEKYVTSKDADKAVTYEAGNADKLPIQNSIYGCLLKDTAKIKNAYCEILNDETYRIVITLIDEKNPTALSAGASATTETINSIFMPYSPAEMISAVTSMTGSTMDFTYTDCTVELIYDKSSEKVNSIKMTMYIDIELDTFITNLNARIVDITEYTNFNYQ